MTTVGLLFVGAVLFVNAAWFLGAVSARDAALFNLLIGALQVVVPTLAMVAADGELTTVFGAGASYLFGFTYLYVGLNTLTGQDGRGLGWYSAFVAAIALVFGVTSVSDDPVMSVIWFTWAAVWALFFVQLACGKTSLGPYIGWVLMFVAHLTCTMPALLIWRGHWPTSSSAAAVAAVMSMAVFVLAALLARALPSLSRITSQPAQPISTSRQAA